MAENNLDKVNDCLYTMNLHDEINFNSTTITRVPGGWIYEISKRVHGNNTNTKRVTSVFVPFNEEFEKSND